jgi:hypothetical protein
MAEKERRSGSMRTAGAYARTLQRFFGTAGKTPEQVPPPDVHDRRSTRVFVAQIRLEELNQEALRWVREDRLRPRSRDHL